LHPHRAVAACNAIAMGLTKLILTTGLLSRAFVGSNGSDMDATAVAANFERVGDGAKNACKSTSEAANQCADPCWDRYHLTTQVDTLEQCQRLCMLSETCKGLEYMNNPPGAFRCELWFAEIAHTNVVTLAEDFQCYKFIGNHTTGDIVVTFEARINNLNTTKLFAEAANDITAIRTAAKELVSNIFTAQHVNVEASMGIDDIMYFTVSPTANADDKKMLMVYEMIHEKTDAPHLASNLTDMLDHLKDRLSTVQFPAIANFLINPDENITVTFLGRKVGLPTTTTTTITTTNESDADTGKQDDEADGASQGFTLHSLLVCVALLLTRS